jgi:DNA polymerase-3 subunit alpha
VVQAIKMKTTKNNSMMAYVSLEDDTASIEMLAFSNVLNQYGGYLKENSPVVITGRLSIRDEKEPQIVINRARPISDFANESAPEPVQQPVRQPVMASTLYLQLTGESDPRYRKVKAILSMFPGSGKVVLFFADNRTRRGTQADFDSKLLDTIAATTGGTSFRASDANGMQKVMQEINALEKTNIEQPQYTEYKEYAPHLAALGALLLLAGFFLENTFKLRLP